MWIGRVSKKASFVVCSLVLSLFGSLSLFSSASALSGQVGSLSPASGVLQVGSNSYSGSLRGNQLFFDGILTSGSATTINIEFSSSLPANSVLPISSRLCQTAFNNYQGIVPTDFSVLSENSNTLTDCVEISWLLYNSSSASGIQLNKPSNIFTTWSSNSFMSISFGSYLVLDEPASESTLNEIKELLESSGGFASSSDISNQTQNLIDNENALRSSDEAAQNQAGSDAQNTTNSWTNNVLSAFGDLFSGLGSFFAYLTNWMTADASVGCAFALPFLNETINVDLCNSLPSDIVSVIRNISAFIVFILVILILKSIFEDVFNLLEGSANAG